MRPLSPGQCRVHETGINMLCEYRLQSGKRIGTQRLAMFDTSVVDGLFGKLLFKEVNGEKRRTTVNHSMKTARTAWKCGRSLASEAGPAEESIREDALATDIAEDTGCEFAELVAFRAKAIEMGCRSLATSALIGWELL